MPAPARNAVEEPEFEEVAHAEVGKRAEVGRERDPSCVTPFPKATESKEQVALESSWSWRIELELESEGLDDHLEHVESR